MMAFFQYDESNIGSLVRRVFTNILLQNFDCWLEMKQTNVLDPVMHLL